ncbi:hypothetical protein [Pedobacter heparinus]|uniref:Uncharacterized protein n=1 Tax=Pedobacter heparinus (strain ATCC 13125 / DSM 2366 / CIP 104194 / JCM 7457 / NBRC 12017 / NCIMB 9290 / NRRL B-14731 / HIM 762-3) TaxID=485917 RepID=C6XTK5_PEDHD|nr:hypothetical protein [Pedobacter heparinus]ACU05783.1 hypothetical protein Phep_3592 [Pedobacter heparinus DSM 2366]
MYQKTGLCLLLTAFLFLITGTAIAQQEKYLLLGTDFQFKGKWFTEVNKDGIGGNILRFMEGELDSTSDALTVMNIGKAGRYTIWIRTPDFETSPRTRLIQLSVGNARLKKAGGHGKPGYAWERLGYADLKSSNVLLRLHNFNFGRCDAILFVQDSTLNPNNLDKKVLLSWKVAPALQEVLSEEKKRTSPSLQLSPADKVIAGIENDALRVQFVRTGADHKAIACKTEVKKDGRWQQAGIPNMEDHRIFLISTDATAVRFIKYYPTWDSQTPNAYFVFNGRKHAVQKPGADMDPFEAGNLSEAIPVSAETIDKQILKVQYVTRNGSSITGLWSLLPAQQHIDLRLICKVARPGYYSMGVAAFQPVVDQELENVLMAPMFQYKRLSDGPQMMVTSMMQQPLAIVSSKTQQGIFSSYVAAGPELFKKDWGSVDYAPAGFTLKNHNNQIQPVMFSPVLGMNDSKCSAGELIERRFVIGVRAGNWDSAMDYVSKEVFEVKDYRKQEQSSLTDAVFSMIELVKNDNAAGWAPGLKGFYDIEGDPKTAPTVVNATPLTNIALSVLQNDEEFYISRSLPTIEFTLSRSGYRWATDIVPTAFNATRKTLELNPFRSQFTTSYYAGLDRLLEGLNPWLKGIALPGDSLRAVKGYSTDFLPWNQALWAYRLTGQAKWLQLAKRDADLFIQHKIYNNTNKLLSHIPFYNATFYAPWWDLLDMYETTKDEKYLKAAEYGAYFTIAGIRSYPKVEDSLQTIHQGNHYDGVTRIWWKGNRPYRLGFPREKGDVQEKKVPEWLVSPVGLGLEQPSTYFTRVKGQTVHPVFMSSWAPHLLRVFQYANKPIYETYARNAVIGRYTNYPGYYATGFTDVPMSADFPYKGPDVSSIYYHHIPPHIAFSLDYLITETIQRSNGNVMFPYSKQEGFVWFNNRVYGGGKGKIFGEAGATLRMHKGLVSIQHPGMNYVTAVSDKNFWILLSSEAGTEQKVTIQWSDATGALKEGKGLCYLPDGQSISLDFKAAKADVVVPAKGFRAISIPLAAIPALKKYQPVKDGMKVIDFGAPWGRIFLFRIRSPFGWDTCYGFAETAPLNGYSVKVNCNNKVQEINQYPYEWGFNKLAMGESATLELIFKSDDGKTKSKKIVLNGNE